MAELIKSDGTREVIPVPTLEQAQKLIGGYVERLFSWPSKKFVLLVDEEGRQKKLPANKIATEIYVSTVLVGNVIVMERKEAKGWR